MQTLVETVLVGLGVVITKCPLKHKHPLIHAQQGNPPCALEVTNQPLTSAKVKKFCVDCSSVLVECPTRYE